MIIRRRFWRVRAPCGTGVTSQLQLLQDQQQQNCTNNDLDRTFGTVTSTDLVRVLDSFTGSFWCHLVTNGVDLRNALNQEVHLQMTSDCVLCIGCNCVVKCSVNMSNTRFDILFHRRLYLVFVEIFTSLFYFIFLTAIAAALPLRVRALSLICHELKSTTVTSYHGMSISIKRLMFKFTSRRRSPSTDCVTSTDSIFPIWCRSRRHENIFRNACSSKDLLKIFGSPIPYT